MKKIVKSWVWKNQDEIMSASAPARLFLMLEQSWSLLVISKRIPQNHSAKPKMNFDHVCRMNQKQPQLCGCKCKHETLKPTNTGSGKL